MGYEGYDRRYGRDYRYDRGDAERFRGGTYGYGPQGYGTGFPPPRAGRGADRLERGGYDRYGRDDYDDEDRGFFERAGDEVRSWFGDEEAERRRRADELRDERYERERDWREARSGNRYTGYDRSSTGRYGREQHHDPSYRSWRDRQMEAFDRDYDEYRRENQGRFDNEFGSWRQTRQGQRDSLTRAREHMEVVGSDGAHVGTVDHVRGDRILLTKTDKDAGGHHHSIPSRWIRNVGDKVEISKTAEEAQAAWRDEENRGGQYGRDEQREGAHMLDRSFSGTY